MSISILYILNNEKCLSQYIGQSVEQTDCYEQEEDQGSYEDQDEPQDTNPSTGYLFTDIVEFVSLTLTKGQSLNLPSKMATVMNDLINNFIEDRDFYRQLSIGEHKKTNKLKAIGKMVKKLGRNVGIRLSLSQK